MPPSASRPPRSLAGWSCPWGPPILGHCDIRPIETGTWLPPGGQGRGQAGLWPDPCRSHGYRAASGNQPCCPRLLGGTGAPPALPNIGLSAETGVQFLPVNAAHSSVISVSGTGRMKKHDCETPKNNAMDHLCHLCGRGAGDGTEDKHIRLLARSRDGARPGDAPVGQATRPQFPCCDLHPSSRSCLPAPHCW